MPGVLIHPSGGDGRGRINWGKSLSIEVKFDVGPLRASLKASELADLLAVHPTGAARFWGTFDEPWRRQHLEATGPGAAVVFTAKNHARAAGRVGVLFKNAAFADLLWEADIAKGSYAWVYSVTDFQDVALPYPVLRSMLELGSEYPFRRLSHSDNAAASTFAAAVLGEVDDTSLGSVNGAPTGNKKPGRVSVTVQRTVRSTVVSRWVKRLHNDACQVCGETLTTPSGPYSEGAHIRGLGAPHDGPDEPANVLCLCPNHHVLFDSGAIYVSDDSIVRYTENGDVICNLRVHPRHALDSAQFAYHRQQVAGIA